MNRRTWTNGVAGLTLLFLAANLTGGCKGMDPGGAAAEVTATPAERDSDGVATAIAVTFDGQAPDLARVKLGEHIKVTEDKLGRDITDLLVLTSVSRYKFSLRLKPGLRDFGPDNQVTLVLHSSFPVGKGKTLGREVELTVNTGPAK